MTEEIYCEDPYIKELWTKVIAVEGNKILTEKTIFFRKTTHQMCDAGFVNNCNVLGVIKQGNDIWHILKSDPKVKEGEDVQMKLNWNNRYRSMRLHTALHLISQVLKKNFRLYAIDLSVNETGGHLKFLQEVDIKTVNESIEKANEVVAKGAEIETRVMEENGKKVVYPGYLPEFECEGLFVKDASEIKSISFAGGRKEHEKFIISITVE